MRNLFYSEFYKFKTNALCVYSIILTIIMAILFCAINYYQGGATALEQISPILSSTTWFEILFIIFCTSYVSNDIFEKTINITITSGYKRTEILFVKLIVISIIFFLTHLLRFLIGMYISGTLSGFGFSENGIRFLDIVSLYLNAFLILYASLLIFFLISVCIEDVVLSVVISVVYLISFQIALITLYSQFNLPEFLYNLTAIKLTQDLLSGNLNKFISVSKTIILLILVFSLSSLNFRDRTL